MSTEKEVDQHSGRETTGHEWDGIKELNTPLPRWWLIVFYISVAVAILYWVLMPSWPLVSSYTKGVRGHSDRVNVAADMDALKSRRAENAALLSGASLDQIEANPALLEFASAAGASAFGDNCATCHGAGGQGTRGYPALVDDDWLWGGTLAEIRHTLAVGIRSGHPQARSNQMPAFGRDGIFTPAQVGDMTEYVLSLSGTEHDVAAAARAKPLFGEQCASCHGPDGKGDQAQGAPNLTDGIWLYGGDRETVRATIQNARAGVMPTWEARLDPLTLDALAVYVHGLGGGE